MFVGPEAVEALDNGRVVRGGDRAIERLDPVVGENVRAGVHVLGVRHPEITDRRTAGAAQHARDARA